MPSCPYKTRMCRWVGVNRRHKSLAKIIDDKKHFNFHPSLYILEASLSFSCLEQVARRDFFVPRIVSVMARTSLGTVVHALPTIKSDSGEGIIVITPNVLRHLRHD